MKTSTTTDGTGIYDKDSRAASHLHSASAAESSRKREDVVEAAC